VKETGELIFLYGSLRRGGVRDATLHYQGAEFVAGAQVRGILYDLGRYPGLRLDPAANWVRGEIFAVTPETLAQLDEWEEIDPAQPDVGEYRRVRAELSLPDESSKTCWVYEVAAARCTGQPIIESGDWLARG
jgi:gamma-glutamylcyclotransferase (GGCT)/AIG2-like uncharacterized protein YtfP